MNQSILFGYHAVFSVVKHRPQTIVKVMILENRTEDLRFQKLLATLAQLKIKIEIVDRKIFDQRFSNAQHQGIAVVCEAHKLYHENDLELLLDEINEPPFLLILDGIKDPHNLGACLRTANAAGVHAVVMPKDRAVSLTPTVCKIASGAAEATPLIQVTNLARTLNTLRERGIWLYGMSEHANKSLYATNLAGPVAILLGEEERGLRRLTRELCDELLYIPMNGWVSSLNVSVATGVCLFEIVRQRH